MGGPSQNPLACLYKPRVCGNKAELLRRDPCRVLIVSHLPRGWFGGQQAHLFSGLLSFAEGCSTASLFLRSDPRTKLPNNQNGSFTTRIFSPNSHSRQKKKKKARQSITWLLGLAKQDGIAPRLWDILTCRSLSPLESESDVSLYVEPAISTSVEARLLFFRGLQESEISLAP